jgi:CheY-like chemotaxis protein
MNDADRFMIISPQLNETRNHARQPIRVLVIDDDAHVGAAIKAVLARHPCETVIASRAYAGIHALRQSRFDVVMVDIFMPGLCGLDTIEHVRRGSSIPIIAMSGFRLKNSADSLDYLGMAARRGATLCMRKPFKPAQLIEAIEWSQSLPAPIEGSAH